MTYKSDCVEQTGQRGWPATLPMDFTGKENRGADETGFAFQRGRSDGKQYKSVQSVLRIRRPIPVGAREVNAIRSPSTGSGRPVPTHLIQNTLKDAQRLADLLSVHHQGRVEADGIIPGAAHP